MRGHSDTVTAEPPNLTTQAQETSQGMGPVDRRDVRPDAVAISACSEPLLVFRADIE